MNPLRDFVYCTQFLQAEAMKYAYNLWRREFRGPGEENCAGALVWQLNDLWPGTSWALVDVDMNPKPAYFAVKRALAKMVVGVERTVTKQPPYITTGYLPAKESADIWAVNGTVNTVKATLSLRMFDIATGAEVGAPQTNGYSNGHVNGNSNGNGNHDYHQLKERQLELPPNRTTELGSIDIPNASGTVVAAVLTDTSSGETLARWVSWPEPLRLVHLAHDVAVTIKYDAAVPGKDKQTLLVSATAPVTGVVLSVPLDGGDDDAVFEDNCVDLVPGETLRISVRGLEGRQVQARYLYDWEMKEGFEL